MDIELDYEIIDPVLDQLAESGESTLAIRSEEFKSGSMIKLYVDEIKHLMSQMFDRTVTSHLIRPKSDEAVRVQLRAA